VQGEREKGRWGGGREEGRGAFKIINNLEK